MFNIGGGEFLVIALVALIVLGPQRLPEAARQAGRAMAELRRLSSGFQDELHNAMSEVEASSRSTGRSGPPPRSADTNGAAHDVAPAVDAVSGQTRSRRAPLRAAPAEPSPPPKAKRTTSSTAARSTSSAKRSRTTATKTTKATATKGRSSPAPADQPDGQGRTSSGSRARA